MEGMLGQFGHGLKNVSYFFCVFFLGNVRTIGISLVKKTQFLSLLPVSRRFTHYPSWLHHLVAYVVGSCSPKNKVSNRHVNQRFTRKPSATCRHMIRCPPGRGSVQHTHTRISIGQRAAQPVAMESMRGQWHISITRNSTWSCLTLLQANPWGNAGSRS
jgi:hypothetical protein